MLATGKGIGLLSWSFDPVVVLTLAVAVLYAVGAHRTVTPAGAMRKISDAIRASS